MAYMKKRRIWLAAALLSSVLLAGCVYVPDIQDIDTAEPTDEISGSFAEQLVGIYKTYSEENGETILQIYQIQNRMIAEVEEEYAAYYAMEWIPVDSQKTDNGTESEQYTVYTFSGFSDFGAYWDSGRQITVTLTDTGFEMTDENGDLTAYIRDEGAEPIHIFHRYSWFFQEIAAETIPDSIIGEWTGASTDGYTMSLQLDADGSMIWCCKKEGEPISVHIGVAAADRETETIKTVTEKVGWADMPWQYDMEYTFDPDGKLILKNPDFGGLLPGDESVGFIKLTDKE